MSKTAKQEDVRFSKFGTVSFTKTTRVNAFIDHLENGKVMTTQCTHCGKVYFPPRADCCLCLSSEMAWQEVSGSGTLVSFSQLKFAPIGFDGDLPYSIALLDYVAFRVFGRIDSSLDIEQLQVGMAMQTVANRLPNGQLNYVFKPANG